MARKLSKAALTDFWHDNYTTPSGLCGLCANSGVIDTRGIRSAAGVPCGGRFQCVCPNGRAIAKALRK